MPKPHQRTRSLKRRLVKLPSGDGLTTRFKKKRAKKARCLECGRPISGIPSGDASKLSQISLSEKRPQRMFGGQLCSICLQESLKRAVRSTPSA